jgi:Na+-transporting NADH:ubiquinone oxidoreductase subunit A
MHFTIKKGLDLPIVGSANHLVEAGQPVQSVGVVGPEYIGMKPSMDVKEGDHVRKGQLLFTCKKNEGLRFTAPAAGTVKAIHRGYRRSFQSLVIDLDAQQEHVAFENYQNKPVDQYTAQEVRALLIESGSWATIRQRPFEKVADVNGAPHSVFITAMDTQPLSPSPEIFINKHPQAFADGVRVLSQLTQGATYVCTRPNPGFALPEAKQIVHATFAGPHPAGNVGTHIHFLDPVFLGKYVWHVGYADVIAIGYLFQTGQLFTDRLIAIVGPNAKRPRMVETVVGARVSELTHGITKEGSRLISGSPLHGYTAKEDLDFLGPFHRQITILEEDTSRELLGWHAPGPNKFSVKNVFVAKLDPSKEFEMTTAMHGSYRAMVPVGSFEKVMPLDILPTQLLRSLVAKDTDSAQDLGCLELAEEDISLLTFVAPGKVDFGPLLRENLITIEAEG